MRSPEGAEFPNRGVHLESRKEPPSSLHRRLYRSVGALGKAVHDRDRDVRRRQIGKRTKRWDFMSAERFVRNNLRSFREVHRPRPYGGAGGVDSLKRSVFYNVTIVTA